MRWTTITLLMVGCSEPDAVTGAPEQPPGSRDTGLDDDTGDTGDTGANDGASIPTYMGGGGISCSTQSSAKGLGAGLLLLLGVLILRRRD